MHELLQAIKVGCPRRSDVTELQTSCIYCVLVLMCAVYLGCINKKEEPRGLGFQPLPYNGTPQPVTNVYTIFGT